MSFEPPQNLSTAQCWDLLAAHEFGRLAFPLVGDVQITPLNYAVDGDRLGRGLLDPLRRDVQVPGTVGDALDHARRGVLRIQLGVEVGLADLGAGLPGLAVVHRLLQARGGDALRVHGVALLLPARRGRDGEGQRARGDPVGDRRGVIATRTGCPRR